MNEHKATDLWPDEQMPDVQIDRLSFELQTFSKHLWFFFAIYFTQTKQTSVYKFLPVVQCHEVNSLDAILASHIIKTRFSRKVSCLANHRAEEHTEKHLSSVSLGFVRRRLHAKYDAEFRRILVDENNHYGAT